MIDVDLSLIERVVSTTRAYPFRVWGFGESIAMEGLLAAGSQFAADVLARWAHTAGPLQAEPLAHVAPGVPLLDLHRRERDPRLLQRAVELAQVVESTQPGQHGARLHRPDLHPWQDTVWVDCMHLDAPFLARLAHVTGEDRWATAASEHLLGHARVLQDSASGLFSHGFDDAAGSANDMFWGRGQGWALLGLVDTGRLLPADSEIRDRLGALVAGLARTEDGTGTWHTIVDRPETYVEPSTSAFVALGVRRAVRYKLIPAEHGKLAQRALAATRASIDASGALVGVSDATPVGHSVEHYAMRKRGAFPWGQGPALLALLEAGGA